MSARRHLDPGCGVVAVLAVGALVSLAVGALVIDGWAAFGRRAQGARQARMAKSPQWHDGKFQNPQPLWNDGWRMITGLFRASKQGSPAGAAAHGQRRRPALRHAAAQLACE